MGKAVKIEPRTISFIRSLEMLKEKGKMPSNKELAEILGINSLSTISEIKAERQNIQPDSWEKFINHYKSEFPELQKWKLIDEYKFMTDVESMALDDGDGDYKLKYIQLLEKTLQEKDNRIKELEQKNVSPSSKTNQTAK